MAKYTVEGCVTVQGLKAVEFYLHAYVLDAAGRQVGSAPVASTGVFTVVTSLTRRSAVEVVVTEQRAPILPILPERPAGFAVKYPATAWIPDRHDWTLHADIHIKPPCPLFLRCSVTGGVHKLVHAVEGDAQYPVVGAIVEVFDVDREPYAWPPILARWSELRYLRTIHLPDLLERPLNMPLRPPAPHPPAPTGDIFHGLGHLSTLNPQPEPPCLPPPDWHAIKEAAEDAAPRLNPQPEPPCWSKYLDMMRKIVPVEGLVGELGALPVEKQVELAGLTLCSGEAPWDLVKNKFYSRTLIGTTHTDASGKFDLDFNWFFAHKAHGRLRLDRKPDIIIRVTQVIDNVAHVIYMDPYTATRWDRTRCKISLVLDDPAIQAGPEVKPGDELAVNVATIKEVGCDPVWQINALTGCYETSGYSNAAYGSSLWIRGDFGPDMVEGDPVYYYRLSYAKANAAWTPVTAFQPITKPLDVWRSSDLHDLPALIASGDFGYTEYNLGPRTVGATENLYEVQDRWHWWVVQGGPVTSPGGMVLGLWETGAIEADTGRYLLRLEVFDKDGNLLPGVQFMNSQWDGASPQDPATSTTVAAALDLKLRVDNALMLRSIDLAAVVGGDYGLLEWTPDLAATLQFPVHLSQPHGRVHAWSLHFSQGVSAAEYELPPASAPVPAPDQTEYPAGTVGVDENVPGAPLLVDPVTHVAPLEHGCAYALNLYAIAHVRTSWGWWSYGRITYPFAIQKC